MRRALAVACCAVLVVLSGCSFGGFGATADAGTPTLTPAPTPTADGPAAGFGPTADGEIAATRLASVHAATFSDTNYTLTVDRGPTTRTVRVAGNRSLTRGGERTTYRSGDRRFVRVRAGDTARTAVRSRERDPPTGASLLATNRTLTVTERIRRDGGTRYVLTASATYENGSGPAPYLRVVADERGRVLAYSKRVYRRGVGVEVVESFTLSAVGETTVATPSWVVPLRYVVPGNGTDG
jgi:hypothetical protein